MCPLLLYYNDSLAYEQRASQVSSEPIVITSRQSCSLRFLIILINGPVK